MSAKKIDTITRSDSICERSDTTMKPRRLKMLRVEDRVDINDGLALYPIDVDRPELVIKNWTSFCQSLQDEALPDVELMTIDFHFDGDKTTPRPPRLRERAEMIDNLRLDDPRLVGADLRDDPTLKTLAWPHTLLSTGTNTGLLIGASLATYYANRDIPLGVAIHTGFSGIVFRDLPSTILVAHI